MTHGRPFQLILLLLSLFSFVSFLLAGQAIASDSSATLQCDSGPIELGHASVRAEEGGNLLRVIFGNTPSDPDGLVMEIRMKTRDGGAVKQQLISYKLAAKCPRRTWTLERKIGSAPGEYDDFKYFEASYRRNGYLALVNEGRLDGFTWKIELESPLQ